MSSSEPNLIVEPKSSLRTTALKIVALGLEPGQHIIIRSSMYDVTTDVTWNAQAEYQADEQGVVDLQRDAPIAGSYDIVGPMGLIWSMTPDVEKPRGVFFIGPTDHSPFTIEFSLETDSHNIVIAEVERLYALPGVTSVEVRDGELRGKLFLPPGDGPFPAIMTLSGSEGGIPAGEGMLYASHGYAALALAYFNYDDLPDSLVRIPLEYFERGINWLQKYPSIIPDRIGVQGGSRGGELALLLGATYPQIKVVIADVPSGVLWGGFGDDKAYFLEPAWTYGGEALPYMNNYDIEGQKAYTEECKKEGKPLDVARMFRKQMEDKELVKQATIPVERSCAAILMISGEGDALWPSTVLTNIIVERLKEHEYPYSYEHISYPGAGHALASSYIPTTDEGFIHPVDNVLLAFGGNPKDIALAREDAWQRRLTFLAEHL